MQPSHEKACFFSFREHAFPQALFISSKQFLQPRFYRFLSIFVFFLEPIWAPLANFFDSNFRDSKNTNCLSRGTPQAEGIWDTSRVRGELGEPLGGQGDYRRPRGVLEEKVAKTIVFFSKLARDPLFCLDETRATLTKCCK